MMSRRHNFQTAAWFNDLEKRKLLDLDPPYQRRSVWNQAFKDYFIDTILLGLPAPALFLYEDIAPDGRSLYHVVDGKQRLVSVFEFVRGEFPVGEKSEVSGLRGKYFSALDDTAKKTFWSYEFLVEYVPSDDEKLIHSIFDRINRNVAKLTPQELRHARLDGQFIQATERLSEWMAEVLPRNFPRVVPQSRMQMKDVELVAQLLLLIEEGPRGFTQDELDVAFTNRDTTWERAQETEDRFRTIVSIIDKVVRAGTTARDLSSTRLRNQADFYSLCGAIHSLLDSGTVPSPVESARRLYDFIEIVESESSRANDQAATAYYEAARSASSDKGPRETRIEIVKTVLSRGL